MHIHSLLACAIHFMTMALFSCRHQPTQLPNLPDVYQLGCQQTSSLTAAQKHALQLQASENVPVFYRAAVGGEVIECSQYKPKKRSLNSVVNFEQVKYGEVEIFVNTKPMASALIRIYELEPCNFCTTYCPLLKVKRTNTDLVCVPLIAVNQTAVYIEIDPSHSYIISPPCRTKCLCDL